MIHRLYNERAFRRERVIRDRSNPLDIYNDEELIERFRFCRRDLFVLIEELSPDLQFVSDRNAALPPSLQLLIALCFFANGAFQNTVSDIGFIDRPPVGVVPLKRGIVAGERLKNTHATLLHSSYFESDFTQRIQTTDKCIHTHTQLQDHKYHDMY